MMVIARKRKKELDENKKKEVWICLFKNDEKKKCVKDRQSEKKKSDKSLRRKRSIKNSEKKKI